MAGGGSAFSRGLEVRPARQRVEETLLGIHRPSRAILVYFRICLRGGNRLLGVLLIGHLHRLAVGFVQASRVETLLTHQFGQHFGVGDVALLAPTSGQNRPRDGHGRLSALS